MSVIEDTRKVLQDFLAPEMRELKVRLDALDRRMDVSEKHADERHAEITKRVDGRHAEMTKRIEDRHADITKRADERHVETMEAIRAIDVRMDRRVDTILDFSSMKERLAALEAERQTKQKVAS